MTDIGKMKFADNLQKLMERELINSQKLARKAGTSAATISAYLNGHRAPRLDNLAAMARSLGASVDDLLKDITLEEMI